jgi:hypothetical protein
VREEKKLHVIEPSQSSGIRVRNDLLRFGPLRSHRRSLSNTHLIEQRKTKMSEISENEFAEVRRPLQDPGHGQVRIRVEISDIVFS